MKRLKFLVFIIIFFTLSAFTGTVDMNGYVRSYMGMLLNGDTDFSIIQNTLDLDFESKSDKVGLKANPYIYHYNDKDIVFNLREVYLDLYFNSFDLRIGKQQVIWGKADGVFITDIVSPKDLSEFLLRDFDEIRMGVTAVKFDYYIKNNTLELVWIPVFSSTLEAEEGSIWRPAMDIPQYANFDLSKKEITPSLKNSEIFLKFSALTSFIDFELMAGYTWDDDPVIHSLKEIDPLTQTILSLTFFPTHHRLTVFGGSFSSTFGGLIIRGEGAFYKGKYFQTSDSTEPEGVVKKDYLQYLIGLDRTIWGIKVSVQFIQKAILDYKTNIIPAQYENLVTFLARKDILRETLHLELFTYIGLDNRDALIRPKITYDFADSFSLLLGANIFTGDKGSFGQFKNNDMVYMKLKYSF